MQSDSEKLGTNFSELPGKCLRSVVRLLYYFLKAPPVGREREYSHSALYIVYCAMSRGCFVGY